MKATHLKGLGFAALCAVSLMPTIAHASVESSLTGLKTTLIHGIMPTLAVIGIGLASFQFFTGNVNAKQQMTYAIIGAIILFAAQSIVDLLSSVVH